MTAKMQESNTNLWPIPRNELEVLVRHAKKRRTYEEAIPILRSIEKDFRGINNPEAYELIDSVDDYFREKDKAHSAFAPSGWYTNPDYTTLSNESIAAAIQATLGKLNAKADWGAIYRILVDYCNWPSTYTDFTKALRRLDLKIPEKIAFDTQSLQKGMNHDWPASYKGWRTYKEKDHLLRRRLFIADFFLNELKKTIEAGKPSIE